jgi:hypothetical protein
MFMLGTWPSEKQFVARKAFGSADNRAKEPCEHRHLEAAALRECRFLRVNCEGI